MKHELLRLTIIVLGLLPFYLLLYKIYTPQTNSFGCFDECMNYGGAYFMIQGKELFSEIFFNHQPMMGYMSYLVQVLTSPQNLYEFLLRHMQVTLLFSFVWNIFLIRRFGLPAIGFLLFYELSKFYVFGYRFLAESFIVYPMVYLTGLIWTKLSKKEIFPAEYILIALCTWFVLFAREPYTFAVLFAYLFLLGIPNSVSKKLSLVVLILLSLALLSNLPLKDYIFSVGEVSYRAVLQGETKKSEVFGLGVFKILFYPFFTFFGGIWNPFRLLLIGFSFSFIILTFYFGFIKRQYVKVGVLIILLGLSNIRVLEPGKLFYEAFHIMQWYGMIIFLVFLMLKDVEKSFNRLKITVLTLLCMIFIVYIFHPSTFYWHKVDRHEQLLTNYGETIALGETVKLLSKPDQTFFIDYANELNLAYWQAQRISPYKYSWYVYVAPGFKEYTEPRREMFIKSPPDFYYGDLYTIIKNDKLPVKIQNEYVRLLVQNKESRLFVKKSVMQSISNEQWERVRQWGFERPK